MLAVDLGEPRARVAEWVERTGLTVPVVIDADGRVGRASPIDALLAGRRP